MGELDYQWERAASTRVCESVRVHVVVVVCACAFLLVKRERETKTEKLALKGLRTLYLTDVTEQQICVQSHFWNFKPKLVEDDHFKKEFSGVLGSTPNYDELLNHFRLSQTEVVTINQRFT